MRHTNQFCHSRTLTFFLSLLLATLGVFPLAAQDTGPSQPAFKGIDGTTIRVGLLFKKQVTTARIQAMRGSCRVTLHTIPKASGTEPLLSEERTYRLAEEEDLALQVTAKGIVARTSDGIEMQEGFSKIRLESEELFNLEVFNVPPFILSGKLDITLEDDHSMSFVSELPIGELIISAVSEFSPSPEQEANKAFLVMARSRAVAARDLRRHASDSYDICNAPHCLEFTGRGANRELIELLMPQITNELMVAGGKVVFPYFQECCGGKISSAKEVFGVEDPVHRALEDRVPGKGSENCFHAASFRWTREFSQEEMSNFLSVSFAGGANRVFLRWDPIQTDPAGRITEVRLYGKRELKMSGSAFLDSAWDFFGINSLKSMCLTLEPMRRTTIFRGKGRGLGVGLCLYGADGLSKKSFKYADILKFYFAGIHLERDHRTISEALPTATGPSGKAEPKPRKRNRSQKK